MVLIIITIFTIIAVWLLNRWRTRASISLALKVPSNRLHNWLSCGPIVSSDTAQAYAYAYGEKYGSNSVCWMGPIPAFLTSDPQTIQDVLKSKNCIDKPNIVYNGLASVVGSGLLTLSEPKWSKHRKIFVKAFSSKILISYIPVFQKEISDTIACIDEKLELKEPIDLFLILKEITVSTSMKTTLKRDCRRMDYNLSEMVNNINNVLKYAADVSFNQLLRVKIIRYLTKIHVHRKAKESLQEFKKVIKDSTEIIINNDITNPSYVPDIMTNLDCGFSGLQQNLLTLKELENNLLNIIGAGFETTSIGLYLVICMLAMHGEYQERAYNEVISVLSDGNGASFTYEQINQLTYLEMIINETMRLFPFAPAVFRIVSNESVKLSNGLTLPIGQIIAIDIYRLHRNKAVYGPEADRFNPENFLPENVKERHPYAFIPFTKGQRFSIGLRYAYLSMKIFLAQLIRNYRFDTDFKFDDLKIVNRVTTHLVQEPEIKIERRDIYSKLK